MRTAVRWILLIWLMALADGWSQDPAQVLKKQKEAAAEAWKSLELGDAETTETAHLLLFASKRGKDRLKSAASSLEKYHATARKLLSQSEADAHPGKVAVFLLDSPEDLTAYIRRVEKRRPESKELGTYQIGGELPRVAACPGTNKWDPPSEARCGEMLAALLMQQKAKPSTPLPPWLSRGFGRATSFRVLGNTSRWLAEQRKLMRAAARKYDSKAIWDGSLEPEEAEPLQASFAEFLSYGLGSARFVKLLESFVPGENQESVSTSQALEKAGLKGDRVELSWKSWVK
ncbi:MAG: hypothetical protein ACKO23_05340 [Gemmataceae bacterium]